MGMLFRGALKVLVLLLLASLGWTTPLRAEAPPAPDRLALTGVIRDVQGRPLKDVQVEVRVNREPVTPVEAEEPMVTSADGVFAAEFLLPAGTLPEARVEVEALRHGFQPLSGAPVKVLAVSRDQEGSRVFQAVQAFTLERRFTPAALIAAAVLLAVYALIALEWMHRTLAASLGAALILFISHTLGTFNRDFYIVSFPDAVRAIDMNAILLLLGMMLIVAVLKKTGLFRWLACRAYGLARGRALFLIIILMAITATASAFIDNLTTMLLMIPVTLELAVALKINPLGLLIPQVFAANLGGSATLIGDPPNILIGSFAHLPFTAFLANLSGVVILCLAAALIYFFFRHRQTYRPAFDVDFTRTLAFLRHESRIKDVLLLKKSLAVGAFTLALLLFHSALDMAPAVAALAGAGLLIAIARVDIVELIHKEVEWPTLLFLITLFVIIAGARSSGLTQMAADRVEVLAQGNLTLAIVLVLWASALASCLVENIAFTAAMLPIVAHLTDAIPGAGSGVLWWSLALGAGLGGNGTMIGASANVITVALAEKAGYPISFTGYLKACFIPMLITVALATAYLLAAY
jgi:Na+/H+ antiporter NhaD/arsenite permease-like protein